MSTCTHLDQVLVDRPEKVAGCEECCDSSPNRHASAHVRNSGHPIVTSVEPGEEWSYCYVDDVAFLIEGTPS